MQRALLVLLAVVGALALWAMRPPRAAVDTPLAPRAALAPIVTGDDLVLGPRSAAHTIVEFGDYTCPACAEVHRAVRELLASRDDVRVIWKDLPHLDPVTQSLRLHIAARCAARQGAFAAFHDALFERAPRTDGAIASIATDLRLNTTAFDACRSDPSITAAIRANEREAMRIGVAGTPEFYVNGVRYEQPFSLSDLQRALDAP
ncbi:MAG: thioredoxin domain-containing protein [bacterium]|nr:thioredoxin domain-containing protein [bacterium]